MSRLMSQFPTEPTNSAVASKYEELEQLYAAVGKVIYEGLANYEKNLQAPPSSLFGTLMMLKAACINNACYIDRLITSFMRVLQRMVREHLAPASPENSAAASELLILSLDLVDLNGQFLEMVNFVYRDEQLKGTELTSKLEPAFLAGLRCVQPHIGAKFFEIFDSSMKKRLHDRLLYVVCSQNWEAMGPHFWIKQCIELMLSSACPAATLTNCTPSSLLPPFTGVIAMADPLDRSEPPCHLCIETSYLRRYSYLLAHA